MTGEGSRLSWAGIRETIYWLSLAAAVVYLVLAFSAKDWWLGDECSFDTGYEHSIGIMSWIPLLFLVGVVEVIVASARARAWRRGVALRLGLVGAGVVVVSFAAFGEAVTYMQQFSCD